MASINVGRYPSGGAIYVQLHCEDGEPLATFSTNLVPYGAKVNQDEFNVKVWGENEQFVEKMMATGLFEDTGRYAPTGNVDSPIWRMTAPAHVPQ